jgi:hypothetical protein
LITAILKKYVHYKDPGCRIAKLFERHEACQKVDPKGQSDRKRIQEKTVGGLFGDLNQ